MAGIIIAGLLASLWTKQHISTVDRIHRDFKEHCEIGRASVSGVYPLLNTELICQKKRIDKEKK